MERERDKDVADADAVRSVLPVARVLGPAALAHVSFDEFRPVPPDVLTVEQLPGDHQDLRRLEKLAGLDQQSIPRSKSWRTLGA